MHFHHCTRRTGLPIMGCHPRAFQRDREKAQMRKDVPSMRKLSAGHDKYPMFPSFRYSWK